MKTNLATLRKKRHEAGPHFHQRSPKKGFKQGSARINPKRRSVEHKHTLNMLYLGPLEFCVSFQLW